MLKGNRSFQRRQETTLASPIKSSQRPRWWRRNWFYVTLITLAIVGVFCAFFLPPLIPGIKSEGETTDSLRKAILAVLAGSLTMLTLSETHRKNNQEKEKNENDHTRQVHAERRSRYTTAVEQLANEKAPVRLGGIYTLTGLVDEWLADDSLTKDKQKEEGQVIINNLCSYIRSPFPLTEKIEEYEAHKELKKLEDIEYEELSLKEHLRFKALHTRFQASDKYKNPEDITADYAKLHEEQDVRRAIFVEMSKRSSKVSVDKSKEVTVTPGAWSGFKFDFSRAPIFYPLNNLTIEQGNFASTRFYGKADFEGAKFARDAYFTDARFAGDAYFTDTKFAGAAYFGGAEFTGDVGANKAEFIGDAYFGGSGFIGDAYFGSAKFTRNADFKGTEFIGIADFGSAEFIGIADFLGTGFTDYTNFRCAYFEKSAPRFADDFGSARFSAQVNQKDYIFSSRKDGRSIHRGTTVLPPMSFTKIPLGAVLFDSTSWDEEKQEYTRISEPAQ